MSHASSLHTYTIRPRQEKVTLHEPSDDTASVPEALVHDLWMHQRFDTDGLSTRNGDPVQILDPGRHNTDAGPDFQNAHVRIGNMDWRGHVEIHNTSGGWFEHEHHTDPRYDSVVLHVTLHADMWTGGLLRSDESSLPEIVLYPRLEAPLRELLHAFRTRADDEALPCAPRWDEVPAERRWKWVHRLARQRLKEKRDRLPSPREQDLDTTLHERLFTGLGYSKNDAPMTTLAQRVSPEMLRRLEATRDREALLLGTAGLLPEPGDLLETDRATADYAMDLRDRFRRLQVRFHVTPMDETVWTFFRLRPNNFPPLRIAQAAAWYAPDAILSQSPLPTLRNAVTAEAPTAEIRDALEAAPGPFWRTHYHLTKEASEHDPSLGASRRNTLIVNAVAPLLLLDAAHRNANSQGSAVIELLRSLPSSRDHVIRRFRALGSTVSSAFDAQGLHQLYREYCVAGGCLECDIGQSLLEN